MKYFPGFTSIEILRRFQQDLSARRINPDKFEGSGQKKGNSDVSISNASEESDCAKEFPRGHLSFLGPGDEEQWC